MTKISLFILSVAVFCLCSCNMSVGYKKDLRSGLSYKYHGFVMRGVIVVDSTNTVMTGNKVPMNSQMAIVALDVSNYGLKDGKAFPGMLLTVTDKTGAAVINSPDLFAGNQGYPPQNASELRGDISIGKPMRTGETYHVKIHVWDKVTAENTADADMDIVVQ